MNTAHLAKAKLRVGAITYDEAKKQVQPYIDAVNEGAKRIAKEFGGSYRKVTVTGFLR